MKTIRVKFHFTTLDTQGLGADETHPRAFFHLSNHLRRSEQDYCELALPPVGDSAAAAVHGQVSGHVSVRDPVVSPNLMLCAAQFAWRPDHASGVNCRVCLGTNYIPLAPVARTRPNASHPWSRDVPFVMHTCNGFVKGRIRLHIDAIEMDDGLSFGVVPSRGVGSPISGSANVHQALQRYFAAVQQQSQRMGNAIAGTERMDAPYNYSEVGFASSVPVPLVGYVMHEVPETSLATWENAADIVLRRDGMRLADWSRLGNTGRARAMVELCSLIGSYTDYTSDVIEMPNGQQSGAEIFGGNRASGMDCEDSSNYNAQMFDALKAFAFPSETRRHEPLREMQRIARQYIALQSLDVVHGAQVSNGGAPKYGAHMKTNFVRMDLFKRGLENTQQGARVASQLPWGSSLSSDYATQFPPFLVGEGTGIADPDQGAVYQDNLAHAKAYVYGNCPSLGAAKKPIGPNSPFFVGSLIGTTNHFLRLGAPYGTFWYTNGPPGQRGVLADDLNHTRIERFGFMPQPRLPALVLGAIRETSALAVPPPSHVLDAAIEDDPARTHPQLERLRATVAQWNRPNDPAKHIAVPVYMRPYQLSQGVTDAIVRDFRRLDRIVRITYHLERISNEFYGYRVMVHVQ